MVEDWNQRPTAVDQQTPRLEECHIPVQAVLRILGLEEEEEQRLLVADRVAVELQP